MNPISSKHEHILKKHILMVNDSRFELNVLKGLLQGHGFCHISTASCAHEALEMIGISPSDRTAYLPDLILMNLVMPNMDGIEACKRIKSNQGSDSIPIIIMTSTDRDEEIQKAFHAGATDFVSIPVREAELIARVETALQLKHEMDQRKAREQELIQLMKKLDEANKRWQELSFIDGLTGIYNRRYFEENLKQEWQRSMRYELPLSLLLIDIDFFKLYNDSYGHYFGDDCLRRVTKSFKESIRRKTDTIARYGGEEFAVLLPETDEAGAKELAQKLQKNVDRLRIPHHGSLLSPFVSVSVGCCTIIPQRDMDPGQLITQADEALYQAKRKGRNQVCVYETEDNRSSEKLP